MRWSDVIAPPSPRLLRQFAGLVLVFCLGLAGWRVWRGHADFGALGLAAAGLGVGLTGLVRPATVRWIYTGWMVVAFPIGWTVSHVALGLMFYGLFTPIAFLFRATGRDELHLRRGGEASSYWRTKAGATSVRDYFRQS